jgi:hypothetical protein
MANSSVIAIGDQPRLRTAFERVRPELVALQTTDLLPINIDPVGAAAQALGALPELLNLRPQMMEQLHAFDISNLDQLETYALALIQANCARLGAQAAPEYLSELVTATTKMRERLVADVSTLSARGYIKGASRSNLRGRLGYRHIASDVLMLSGVLRTYWATVAAKCAVTESELDQAEILGDRLIQTVGLRERVSVAVAEAAIERQKVFTLFVRAYNQVRKAVTYLRWELGDAENLAPSLYLKQNVSRRKATSNAEAPRGDTVPPAQAVEQTAAVAPEDAVKEDVPTGLPGSNPFLH